MSESELLFPLLDTAMQLVALLSLGAVAVFTLPSPQRMLRSLHRRRHRQPDT